VKVIYETVKDRLEADRLGVWEVLQLRWLYLRMRVYGWWKDVLKGN
jgi:hypothetical protein